MITVVRGPSIHRREESRTAAVGENAIVDGIMDGQDTKVGLWWMWWGKNVVQLALRKRNIIQIRIPT